MTSTWNQGGSCSFFDGSKLWSGSFNDTIYYAFPPLGTIAHWHKNWSYAVGSISNTTASGSIKDSVGSFTSKGISIGDKVNLIGYYNIGLTNSNWYTGYDIRSVVIGINGSFGTYVDWCSNSLDQSAGTNDTVQNELTFYYIDNTTATTYRCGSNDGNRYSWLYLNPYPTKEVWKIKQIGYTAGTSIYGSEANFYINFSPKNPTFTISNIMGGSIFTVTGGSIYVNYTLSGGSTHCVQYNISKVPNLPQAWAECNGQTISDVDSPYNGSVVPNLNGSGFSQEEKFLLGSLISGSTNAGSFHVHYLTTAANSMFSLINPNVGPTTERDIHAHYGSTYVNAGSFHISTPLTGSNNYNFTLPSYYNLVSIMRIK